MVKLELDQNGKGSCHVNSLLDSMISRFLTSCMLDTASVFTRTVHFVYDSGRALQFKNSFLHSIKSSFY